MVKMSFSSELVAVAFVRHLGRVGGLMLMTPMSARPEPPRGEPCPSMTRCARPGIRQSLAASANHLDFERAKRLGVVVAQVTPEVTGTPLDISCVTSRDTFSILAISFDDTEMVCEVRNLWGSCAQSDRRLCQCTRFPHFFGEHRRYAQLRFPAIAMPCSFRYASVRST